MREMRKVLAISAILVLTLVLSGCGGTPGLAGQWLADDGTGIKVFQSDGQCSGMMYFRPGDPTDVGGGVPMYCSLSSDKDTKGRYTLDVSQSFSGFTNQVSLKVAFNGEDRAEIYDTSGDLILTLTKN